VSFHQADYRPGQVVFISHGAQARCAQQEGYAMHGRFESDPARCSAPVENRVFLRQPTLDV